MQQLEKDEKNAAAIRWTVTVSVSAILICGLIFFLLFQRKRRKLTERFLVRTNQRWAGIEASEENQIGDTTKATEQELGLFEQIDRMLNEQKFYNNPKLIVEDIASALNTPKNNVSRAINLCRKETFNSYINEYRIKDSMHILRDDPKNRLTMDAIATMVGFNDRHSFLRPFFESIKLSLYIWL
jgi:AraC-like DNA-binding protein